MLFVPRAEVSLPMAVTLVPIAVALVQLAKAKPPMAMVFSVVALAKALGQGTTSCGGGIHDGSDGAFSIGIGQAAESS